MTCSLGVSLLGLMNNISIWWHALGTTSLVIAVLAKAPTHQSARTIFTKFYDGTGDGAEGWSERASPAYVALIGILMAQYTLTGMLFNQKFDTFKTYASHPIIILGFDASAHMYVLPRYCSSAPRRLR